MHNSFLPSPPVKQAREKKLPGFQQAFLSDGTPAPAPPTLSICFHKYLGLTSSPHLPQHRVPPVPQRHTYKQPPDLPAGVRRHSGRTALLLLADAALQRLRGRRRAERRRRSGADLAPATPGGAQPGGMEGRPRGSEGRVSDAAAPWLPHWTLP